MYGTLPVGLQSAEAKGSQEPGAQGSELVRTQVYLSADQRCFLRNEGQRKGVSMAEALREIIAVAMKPAAVSWEGNPLLDTVVEDAGFESPGTGSESADTEIYGQF